MLLFNVIKSLSGDARQSNGHGSCQQQSTNFLRTEYGSAFLKVMMSLQRYGRKLLVYQVITSYDWGKRITSGHLGQQVLSDLAAVVTVRLIVNSIPAMELIRSNSRLKLR